MSDAAYYISLGMERGADHVVEFSMKDIVFDSRTILKCMYGCKDWGVGLTCPSRPGALKPWEYQQIFSNYRWGVIIHSHEKKMSQEVSFALEQAAFLQGCYFAFSLSDCALCKECAGLTNVPCRNPRKARPAFHSVGIDVFKTVHHFGLPLSVLHEGEEVKQNWYSAVFIE
ncbi:MAG: DUF2284 domain-containing protein [Chitinivibrionales bacterium]|nr:DUF2284 domain-containing protein [Chitinivibrionales bacterium]